MTRPKIHKVEFKVNQKGNTLGTTEELEYLDISFESQEADIATGSFITIKSETGWSFDHPDEFKDLIQQCNESLTFLRLNANRPINIEDEEDFYKHHSVQFDEYDNAQIDMEFNHGELLNIVESDDTQETVQYPLPTQVKSTIFKWGPHIPSYVNYLALTNLHEIVGSSTPFELSPDDTDTSIGVIHGWRPLKTNFDLYIPRDQFVLGDVFTNGRIPYWQHSYDIRPGHNE